MMSIWLQITWVIEKKGKRLSPDAYALLGGRRYQRPPPWVSRTPYENLSTHPPLPYLGGCLKVF